MNKFRKCFLLIIVFLFILFLGTNVFAKSKNISVEKVEILDKSGTIDVSNPIVEDNGISSNIVFNEINDFVTFRITVKNNEKTKYKIDSIKNNNKNENISIECSNTDEYVESDQTSEIIIKLTYSKKLINVEKIDISDLTITLNLINEKGDDSTVIINNPVTGDNLFMYILFFVLSISGLIIIKKSFNNKKIKYSGLLLIIVSIIILPFTAFAIDEFKITFNFSSIKVVGEFENYNVSFNLDKGSIPIGDIVIDEDAINYDENGNIIIEKEVKYGKKIGELPEIPMKDGYIFDKWVDSDGKEITEDTIITGPIEITATYKTITYKITYELNGGRADNPKEYTVEDEIELNNPTKKGYTFAGWTGSNGDELQTKVVIPKGSTGDKNYIANFVDNEKVSYKVINMYEKIDGGYDTVIDELEGAYDTEVTPQVIDKEGFVSPETQTIMLSKTNENIVTYIYNREKYNFVISDRRYVSNDSNSDGDYLYGTEITVKVASREGYDFKWSDGNTNYERIITLTSDLVLTPIYTAKTDIPYTVVHKTMNLDGVTYSVKDSYNLTGTADTFVTPTLNEYEGFTSPSTQTKKINANGTTIIEYLYERNKYTLTVVNPEFIEQGNVSGKYYYGSEITLTAKDRNGYTFNEWSNNKTNKTIVLKIINNTNIEAKYNADMVGYKVIHKIMNVDGTSFSEEIEEKTGLTDSNVTPSIKNLVGFTLPALKTVKINGNGTTEIEYIYVRNKYQVTINNSLYVEQGNISGEYYYGKELTLTAKDRSGHTFKKWSNNESNKQIVITVTGNITIGPIYDVNTFTVTFNSNGGTSSENERIVEEFLNIGTLPTATKENYLFTGWYTSINGGTKINGAELVTEDTTYYAHYKKSLNGAVIGNSSINIKIDENKIIGISNVDEDITYTSNNISIATVDNSGKVTGVGVGETTITIKGIESNETKIVTVKVNTNKYLINFDSVGGNNIDSREIVIGSTIGSLVDPVKTNYIFTGWYTSISDGIKITSSTVPISDTTYYAHWVKSINGALISNSTIELQDGETGNIEISNVEEAITYTSNNTNIATVDSNGLVTAIGVGETTITIKGIESNETKTVTIKVNPIKYSILFNSQGGPTVSSKKIVKGSSLGSLENIERDNYIFLGWFTEPNGGTQVNENTIPSGNTTYYAHYKKSLSGAIIANSIIEIEIAQTETIEISNVEEDVTYTSADSSIATVNSNGLVTGVKTGTTTVTITGNESGETKIVNVKINTNTYTIIFDSNGGSNVDNIEVVKGSKIGTLPVNPTKENYVFSGWFTNPSGGTQIDENTIPSGNTTYYAHYKKSLSGSIIANQEITIIIDEEEYIGVSNVEEAITYTSDDPTIATVSSDGKVTGIGVGDAVITITGSESGETKTVTVRVNTNKYTINFDSCGGNNISSKEVVFGSKVGTLSIPLKENYIFIGWFTLEDGGTQINEDTIPSSNTTYYAHYKKSLSGAEISNSSIVLKVDEEETILVSNVDEEISFTSSDTSIATVDSNGKVRGISAGEVTITITGNESHETKIVSVRIKLNTYTISFDSCGGNDIASKEIDEGSKVGTLNNSIRTNYIFVGWFTSEDGGTQINEDTIPSGDTTYYAHWKKSLGGAVITNSSIEVKVSYSKTIGVSNVDEAITYTSNNPNIATVYSNGSVLGVGVGETTITITGNESSEVKIVNVTVTPIKYTITFNTQGGTSVNSIEVIAGEGIGALPTTTRTGYDFEGWYTTSNGGIRIGDNIVPTQSTTYYAHWIDKSFPLVFNEPGECTFNGASGVITGSNCSYANGVRKYIDTGIDLYNSTNHDKDYEIGFTIVTYDPDIQEKQATFVNTKLEGNNYPGLVFRRKNEEDSFDLSSRRTSSANAQLFFEKGEIQSLKIYRIYNSSSDVQEIFYSINGEDKVKINDLSSFNPTFDLSVWFGAAPKNASASTAQRHLIGTLKNMYIRLGKYVDLSNEKYTVYLSANGGSVSPSSYTVDRGEKFGNLPTPTRNGFVFDGWYTSTGTTGLKVDENSYPGGNITIYARWSRAIDNSTVTPTSIEVEKEATTSFKVTNVGEEYTVESSDTSIATVTQDGLVTGVSEGTTTIVLTGVRSGKTKSIPVKVVHQTYTITYNATGGTVSPSTKKVDRGSKIGSQPVPTREGYGFIGWYTSEDGGTKVENDYVPINHTELYAHWEIGKYTISFDSAGGSIIEPIAISGNSEVGQLPEPNYHGYIFGGWYSDNTYTTQVTSSTIITSNVTYYAKWISIFSTESLSTIVNNLKTNNIDNYHVGDTKEIELSNDLGTHTIRIANLSTPKECNSVNFSQTGCGIVLEFADIIVKRDFSEFVSSDPVTNGINNKGGWEYSEMRDYVNNDIYNALPQELKDAIIDTNVISSHGYRDNNNIITTDKLFLLSIYETGLNSTYDSANNVTRTLDYYANSNSNSSRIKKLDNTASTWWTRSAISNSSYNYYVIFSNGTTSYYSGQVNDNYGVSPAFRIDNIYTVNLDGNGGTVNPESLSIKVDSPKIGELPTPTREGYEFVGWYTDLVDGIEVTSDFEVSENITIIARWKIGTYTVTFDSNGGSNVDPVIRNGFEEIGTLPKPEKDGTNFVGWFTNTDYIDDISSTTQITRDTTFYAKWGSIFESSSWDTIINNIISGNTDDYNVGDSKLVDLGDYGKHTLRIANKSIPEECNSTLFSQSGCGVVLEFADIISNYQFNTSGYIEDENGTGNKGGWKYSAIRSYVNTNIYNALPSVIKNAIIDTTLISGHGINDTENFITVDKVYLLSTKEIWGQNPGYDSATTNVRQLDYYKNNNVTTSSNYSTAIKKYNKNNNSWWTRSPYNSYDSYTYLVETNGNRVGYGANSNVGVSPAFRIGSVYKITFNADGGDNPITTTNIYQGNSIGTLPVPTKKDYRFLGWYTGTNNETEVDSSYVPTSDVVLTAKWYEEKVCQNNNNITIINEVMCPDNMNVTLTSGIVCKRAETLHQEKCSLTGYGYCSSAGFSGSNVTYGNCGVAGEFNSGDAFTCDVNGDGFFNEITERFYYVSDYYDTDIKAFNDEVAVLIYYNYVSDGLSCNSEYKSYDSSSDNFNGPVTAVLELPTTEEWKNVSLYKTKRQILAEGSGYHDKTFVTTNYNLPVYDYSGYAARLITAKEVMKSCNTTNINVNSSSSTGYLTSCNYLFENSKFTQRYSGYDLVFETPLYNSIYYLIGVDAYNRSYLSLHSLDQSGYGDFYAIRPAIEVPKNKISYGGTLPNYRVVTLNPNGGTVNPTSINVTRGETIGVLPTPTPPAGKEFIGWYSGLSSGVQIDENFSPTTAVTIYAIYVDINYTIAFDTDGGNSIDSQTLKYGNKITKPSNPTKYNYTFDNWYTDKNYDTVFDFTNMTVTGDTVIYAKWIVNDNACLANMDVTVGNGIICKRALSLHKEKCNATNASYSCLAEGYSVDGTQGTDTIMFGNCGTEGILAPGDAFTCDVNGDNYFDEEKERFYYVSDYYNTNTSRFETDTATLIYYSNVGAGEPENAINVMYCESGLYGPYTAIKQLPTKSQWSNVLLKYNSRRVGIHPNHYSSTSTATMDYSIYGARLLTLQEIGQNCDITYSSSSNVRTLQTCHYILEGSSFGGNGHDYWVENVYSSSDAWYISGWGGRVNTFIKYWDNMYVRPAIDVSKSDIEYGANPRYYKITFNANGGTVGKKYMAAKAGYNIGTLPTPTAPTGKIFDAWYADLDYSVKITDAYIPTENITAYARYVSTSN